jgi:mRNA interferase RelE/StbE
MVLIVSYTLLIKKQAKKALQNASRPDRNRITEKIVLLGENPDSPSLDVKKLQGEPYFRLRVGKWRVIFNRDEEVKIIAIEKIKSRGDVYK